jgi:uncharacterized protein YeaO (DUF488 family)
MTDLFTCSYRAFTSAMGQPVVTSCGLPRWRPEAAQWPRCWLLTPTPALFHTEDWAEFEKGYLARLDSIGPAKIARVLERIAREHQAERLILLCHEWEASRCHRGALAGWLLATTGELACELGGPR